MCALSCLSWIDAPRVFLGAPNHGTPLEDFLFRWERHSRHGSYLSDAALLGRDLQDRPTGEALDRACVVVVGIGECHRVPTTKTIDFHVILLNRQQSQYRIRNPAPRL